MEAANTARFLANMILDMANVHEQPKIINEMIIRGRTSIAGNLFVALVTKTSL
jgi:hypothetical protein